jgi:hypothetical protein
MGIFQVFVWQTTKHERDRGNGEYADVCIVETASQEIWEYNGSTAKSRDTLVQPGAYFVKQLKNKMRVLVGTISEVETLPCVLEGTKRFRLTIQKMQPIQAKTKDALLSAMGFRHIKGDEYMYGMTKVMPIEKTNLIS